MKVSWLREATKDSSSNVMKILVTGPTGSGKTTQAEILSKELGINFINTGDLLRKIAQKNTKEGKLLNKALDCGQLANDALVGKIVRNKLKELQFKKGFIADGYPRRLHQLRYFDPQYDKVVYLDVADSVVLKRLLERGREDDTPKLIRKRLRLYHERTEDVLNYYQRKGKLIKVDASKPIKEVAQDVLQKLQGEL